jgi:hypothetical protein
MEVGGAGSGMEEGGERAAGGSGLQRAKAGRVALPQQHGSTNLLPLLSWLPPACERRRLSATDANSVMAALTDCMGRVGSVQRE